MASHDIDQQVSAYLGRIARREECLETAPEIAQATGRTAAQVRASLKRLKASGKAREVGEAASGARTWALTSDSRFPVTAQ